MTQELRDLPHTTTWLTGNRQKKLPNMPVRKHLHFPLIVCSFILSRIRQVRACAPWSLCVSRMHVPTMVPRRLNSLRSWEWFISLDFDWMFISGKKRFRWPMVRPFTNFQSLELVAQRRPLIDFLFPQPVFYAFCTHWHVRL